MALRDEFTAAISEVMGRRVTAFMSNTHDDPPLIVEIFLLEPASEGDRSDGAGPSADGVGLSADGAGLSADGAGLSADGAGLSADGAGPSI